MIRIIGRLAAGSGAAQALQFVAAVWLARMYSPAQFGEFGQLIVIGGLAATVGTLQMHLAMVLPRTEKESCGLLAAGMMSSSVAVLLLFGALTTWGRWLFPGGSAGVPLLCAAYSGALCVTNLLNGWMTARGQFGAISLFLVARSTTIVVTQTALGTAGVQAGLIYGLIAGEIMISVCVLATRFAPPFTTVTQLLPWRRVFATLKSYRDFSLTGTIQELISIAAHTAPLYFFARVFSSETGGQYAMSYKLVWAPVSLLGGSAAQVLFTHFAGLDASTLRKHASLGIGRAWLPVLLAGLIAILSIPGLMTLGLGDTWKEAAQMSRWNVVRGVAFLIVIPYRVCFRVLRCQGLQALVDGALLVLVLALFLLGGRVMGPMSTLAALTLLFVVQNASLAMIIKRRLAL